MRSVRGPLGRAALLAGSVLLTAGAATACGADGQQNSAAGEISPTTSSVPPTTTSSSSPAPTTSSVSEEPTTTANSGRDSAQSRRNECTAGTLKLDLVGGEGAAGTVYRKLKFTNSGGKPCVIQGFPGVSYVAGDDGHQVGAAAKRVGEKGPPITLRPGQHATASVGFTNVQVFDKADCKPTSTRGLRVYPPHDTAAMFVPFESMGCAGQTPDPQLKVKTTVQGG